MTEITEIDVGAARNRLDEAQAELHSLRVQRALQGLLEEDLLQEDSYDLLTQFLVAKDQKAQAEATEVLDQLDVVRCHLETVIRRPTGFMDWDAFGRAGRIWWRQESTSR